MTIRAVTAFKIKNDVIRRSLNFLSIIIFFKKVPAPGNL